MFVDTAATSLAKGVTLSGDARTATAGENQWYLTSTMHETVQLQSLRRNCYILQKPQQQLVKELRIVLVCAMSCIRYDHTRALWIVTCPLARCLLYVSGAIVRAVHQQ